MNILRPFLILVFSLTSITLAEAHAFLDHADPAVGSILHAPPMRVTVWMTRKLDGPSCKLQVFDVGGAEVDKKDVRVNDATMTVSLPVLGAGTYQVRWIAVCLDTHKTTGNFDFTIR